ncbi:MAG: heme exporter protein CcmD [Gammaproteobacteria bacterium]|nr:heme exporter protein CcmD [Gammaproteobacteria bacterium]
MESLEMGSYGIYVWTCFGLALAVVVLSDWRARLRHKRVYKEIKTRIKALEGKQ